MMAYSTEQMARDLKAARVTKGLSQRALSNLAGVPQSHISRIEKGRVDLRLSSLVEIARALDLEVTLVPRKNLAAVRSIIRRSLADRSAMATKETAVAARVSKELQRLKNTIAKISQAHPAMKEIAQFQRRVNDLGRLKLPTAALDDIKKINESLKFPTAESDTLRKITESLNQVQHLRSRLAHAHLDLPEIEKIRPAYSLEEDDHG